MTTTPPADLADLEALDVDALDGIELATAIGQIRGWTHIQEQIVHTSVPTKVTPVPSMAWIGTPPGENYPMVGFLPRPDRDEKAAVQLLDELMRGNWQINSMGVAPPNDSEPELRYIYLRRYSDDMRVNVTMNGGSTCLLICRAYLKAWQAEREAERESS